MTMDEMKALAQRSLRMWSSTVKDNPDEVFLAGYMNHQQPLADGGVATVDLAQWRAIVEANHIAFPDLSVDIMSQVGEGDRVATMWRFSATQTGPYEGQAPTGRKVSWTGIQIDRFDDGKIAESWVVWDKYTMFSTLGLVRPNP